MPTSSLHLPLRLPLRLRLRFRLPVPLPYRLIIRLPLRLHLCLCGSSCVVSGGGTRACARVGVHVRPRECVRTRHSCAALRERASVQMRVPVRIAAFSRARASARP